MVNDVNVTCYVPTDCDRDSEKTDELLMRTGIQKEVLALYKSLHRAARGRPGFDVAIRAEFKKNAIGVGKTDTFRIEHMVRNGKRKLEMLEEHNVSSITFLGGDNAKK